MNSYILIASVLAQLCVLVYRYPVAGPVSWAFGALAVYSFFALTRERWGKHLDMFLIMLGPGALAMLLPAVDCHLHATSMSHLAWMSFAMWAVSLPWMWRYARCFQDSPDYRALALDAAGMQAGMMLVHMGAGLLPARFLASPVVPWLGHGLMLLGMTLGMLAASYVSLELSKPKLSDASGRTLRSSL
jgi:hypothetical protein